MRCLNQRRITQSIIAYTLYKSNTKKYVSSSYHTTYIKYAEQVSEFAPCDIKNPGILPGCLCRVRDLRAMWFTSLGRSMCLNASGGPCT